MPPHKHFGTPGYFYRAAFYITFMTVVQGMWCYYGSSVTIAFFLGCAQALIGLNVQHDANHGAASKKYWVNELLGYGADMIGGSKYSWIEQHWTHHAYTNHNEKDGDALSAEPLMLFNDYPKGDPRRKVSVHAALCVRSLTLSNMYFTSLVARRRCSGSTTSRACTSCRCSASTGCRRCSIRSCLT